MAALRTMCRLLVAGAALLAHAVPALADYPDHPVRLVKAFGAKMASDLALWEGTLKNTGLIKP